MISKCIVSLAAAIVTMAVSSAFAAGPAPKAQDFVKQLFGTSGKGAACFTRNYDANHLAAHPRQNVKSMRAMVIYNGSEYQLTIGTSFRSRPRLFLLSGDCGNFNPSDDAGAQKNTNTARCSIACDGGSIGIEIKNSKSILITIPEGASVWDPIAKSEDDTTGGAFGTDDKLFRLDRAAASDCLPVTTSQDERDALIGKK